jgi:hypothetical protein
MKNAAINRREALAVASAITLVAGVRTAEAADEPAPDPVRFAKPEPQTSIGLAADAITHSSNVSPDGRAITILFDKSMQFSFDQYASSLTKTWAAALQIPQVLQKMPPSIVFMAIARGFVEKGPAVRIVVTLDFGGVNRVVEFPFGQASGQKDWDATVFSPLPMVTEQGTTPAGGTTETLKTLDLGYYPLAITVTMQRATIKDQGVVTVDTIDIETLTPKITQAAKKRVPVAPASSR